MKYTLVMIFKTSSGKKFSLYIEGVKENLNDIEINKKVDELTARLKADGYEVLSGPRTTGDGYYESCIVSIEGNQIELTV